MIGSAYFENGKDGFCPVIALGESYSQALDLNLIDRSLLSCKVELQSISATESRG
jgi:hypothetical protein